LIKTEWLEFGGTKCTNFTTGKTDFVTVIVQAGKIVHLFTNCIIKASSPGNRAKTASDSPYKLPDSKFVIIDGNGGVTENDVPALNIDDVQVTNGINFSVNNNTVKLEFDDFELYSNQNNTFNVTIPDGSVEINNALDMKMRFNPIQAANPLSYGSTKELNGSIYSTVDADITLNLEATTNGSIDLVDEETTIAVT